MIKDLILVMRKLAIDLRNGRPMSISSESYNITRPQVLARGANPATASDLAYIVSVIAKSADASSDEILSLVSSESIKENADFLDLVSLVGEQKLMLYAPDVYKSNDRGVKFYKPVPIPVNLPPIAVPDNESVTAGESITISVLTNDSDPEGSLLTIVSFTNPNIGTVVNNNNGTFTYTAPGVFDSNATFTYTIRDNKFNLATTTVTITPAVCANYVTTMTTEPSYLEIQIDDSVLSTLNTIEISTGSLFQTRVNLIQHTTSSIGIISNSVPSSGGES